MRIKRKYEKVMLHPIMTFCLLIFGTIILLKTIRYDER